MNRFVLILLILPIVASADPESWMKKDNPDELLLIFRVNEACPFSQDEGRKIVTDVLTRARIKSLKPELGVSYHPPFFQVLATCTNVNPDSYWFTYAIDFLGTAEAIDGVSYEVRWGDVTLGSSGVDNSTTLKNVLRQDVEDAITGYLKANFDLGEDE